MPFSSGNVNGLLDYWGTNDARYMSVHSAYSATGANEISGGSPAYARLLVSWASASGESKSLSGTPYTFNMPASSSGAWIGFWDALTSGNFAGMFPSGNATGFTFTAPASTDTLLAPGSAYAANQTAVVLNTGGSALPSGIVVGTVYYAVSVSGDSFQLSATSGGSAINLTSDGSGIVQAITVLPFPSQGTLSVSALTVTGV